MSHRTEARRGGGPGAAGRASRHAIWVALLAILPACASSTTSRPTDRERPPRVEIPRTRTDRAPAWVGRSASPDLVRELDDWMRNESYRYTDYWQVEGELRLAITRLEVGQSSGRLDEWTQRQVRDGLRGVFESSRATDAQRRNAEFQLDRIPRANTTSASTTVQVQGIIPRTRWGAQPPRPGLMDPAQGRYRYITVHHSAMDQLRSPDGSLASSASVIRDIQSAHMNGEGYGDIGYHFLIDPAGRIFMGRDARYQGAHAGGDNNIGNLGICLIGNFEIEHPSRAAIQAMDDLIEGLLQKLQLPRNSVRPHHYWKATRCPGRHLEDHLLKYR